LIIKAKKKKRSSKNYFIGYNLVEQYLLSIDLRNSVTQTVIKCIVYYIIKSKSYFL
jgi:hypothetical protein